MAEWLWMFWMTFNQRMPQDLGKVHQTILAIFVLTWWSEAASAEDLRGTWADQMWPNIDEVGFTSATLAHSSNSPSGRFPLHPSQILRGKSIYTHLLFRYDCPLGISPSCSDRDPEAISARQMASRQLGAPHGNASAHTTLAVQQLLASQKHGRCSKLQQAWNSCYVVEFWSRFSQPWLSCKNRVLHAFMKFPAIFVTMLVLDTYFAFFSTQEASKFSGPGILAKM